MAITYIGTSTSLTRVRRYDRWRAESGDQIVEEYVGPLSVAESEYIVAKSSGFWDEVEFSRDKGKGMLTLAVSTDATTGGGFPIDPKPVWEVVGQDLFRNIRAFGGGTTAGVVFNAAADQEDLEAVRLRVESAEIEGLLPLAEPMSTYARLLLRGTNEFVRSTAILRSTIVVNSRTSAKASWVGVDRAWKLSGEAGSPAVPGTGASAIVGVIGDMPDADATKKQWLKRAPQIRSLERGRYQIAQEWWFSRRWSYALYDGDNEADNP
jgi:hypothetical protein